MSRFEVKLLCYDKPIPERRLSERRAEVYTVLHADNIIEANLMAKRMRPSNTGPNTEITVVYVKPIETLPDGYDERG